MKNIILLIITSLIIGFTHAQNAQYEEAMSDAIKALNAAESAKDIQEVANVFERIVQADSSNWLPVYYLAFAHNNLAWMSLEKQDFDAFEKHFKAAQEAIDQAKLNASDQAEIFILEAYNYQALIMREPMVNGPRYSQTCEALIKKAQSLDADNPRASYLLALQWLHMPAFLGGGKEKALPQFEKAAENFENYQIASDLHPNWGAAANLAFLSKLKGKS